MKCYVCKSEELVQEHHLIPQSRGGKNYKTVDLCVECHTKSHLLAISKIQLSSISNEKLKKIVAIIRLANKKLPHAEFYNVNIQMPEVLHAILKGQAKANKMRMEQVVLSILLDYFVNRNKPIN